MTHAVVVLLIPLPELPTGPPEPPADVRVACRRLARRSAPFSTVWLSSIATGSGPRLVRPAGLRSGLEPEMGWPSMAGARYAGPWRR